MRHAWARSDGRAGGRTGGRLMIADVRATRQHQAQLAKLGMKDVARRRLGWRFLRLTRLVTATKPERPG